MILKSPKEHTINITNSQCGNICGYFNLETGAVYRQDKSSYKPKKSSKFAEKYENFFLKK